MSGTPAEANVDPLPVPRARRGLADEIRRASRCYLACRQRIDRFHLATVGLLVVALSVRSSSGGAATAILVVVGAGLVHGFAPWLERAARHAEFARAIFALGSELDRQGPGIPLARLCLLQARFDVLVVKLPPPPSRAPTIRARPETGLLR